MTFKVVVKVTLWPVPRLEGDQRAPGLFSISRSPSPPTPEVGPPRTPSGTPLIQTRPRPGGWSAGASCRCLSPNLPGLGRDVESACRIYRPRDPKDVRSRRLSAGPDLTCRKATVLPSFATPSADAGADLPEGTALSAID